MAAVFQKFSEEQKALINPEDTTEKIPGFPECCVTTFSENIINKYAGMHQTEVIGQLYFTNGSIPVYRIIYRDIPIAFFLSRVGAPACAVGLEEVIAMGAKRIVLFGSCGILESSADGKIIVPASAVRDEGTSYHYLEASEEISAEESSVSTVVRCLERCGYPYITGKTWTTDGIYRETASLIRERKEMGCLAVEMEYAAALAVTGFRKVDFRGFLYGADYVEDTRWEPRDLTDYGLTNAEKYMALAFECALE